ncbi:MAG: sodium:glutamate symporter [Clostridia bacterium]|nr:sodium:glutamate symporter [Clostridia bacterium]
MNYSASNTSLWNLIIQVGLIALFLLLANLLRRKIPFFRKSLMPTAVLAGFLFLILRTAGLLIFKAETLEKLPYNPFDTTILETVTYHGIAIGFIALSLRVTKKSSEEKNGLIAPKSGALIVSTYLVQGIAGLVISLLLFFTFMPNLFAASGILLPMGYGQGPGQANNIGTSFENLGFAGGRSFGLAIAAAGYLCACIVGVIYINVLARRRKRERAAHDELSGSVVTVADFQDENEIPIAESLDKFSVQFALVIFVYLITFAFTWGVDALITKLAPGVAKTVSPLLWGFNFIIGTLMAMLTRKIIGVFRKTKAMTRQYQNNYLLSRISGLAFDLMIVCGIASINIEDLSGLWVPFVLMAVAGGVATFFWLKWLSGKIYPSYAEEAFVSMYGMMTGTISSGVMLLREIDPNFRTPAANNLLTGSAFAIVFGAPMLLLVGLAPQSLLLTWVTLGLLIVYLALLLVFLLAVRRRKDRKADAGAAENADA